MIAMQCVTSKKIKKIWIKNQSILKEGITKPSFKCYNRKCIETQMGCSQGIGKDPIGKASQMTISMAVLVQMK
jgi:hypothetical protein